MSMPIHRIVGQDKFYDVLHPLDAPLFLAVGHFEIPPPFIRASSPFRDRAEGTKHEENSDEDNEKKTFSKILSELGWVSV